MCCATPAPALCARCRIRRPGWNRLGVCRLCLRLYRCRLCGTVGDDNARTGWCGICKQAYRTWRAAMKNRPTQRCPRYLRARNVAAYALRARQGAPLFHSD
jgi:hypothetical protein